MVVGAVRGVKCLGKRTRRTKGSQHVGTAWEGHKARTESDVADILRSFQVGQMSDLERRISVRVENLGCVLDSGQTPRIYKLLLSRKKR